MNKLVRSVSSMYSYCLTAAVSEALDEILEMMETLINEYSYQDKQLNKMHATLTVLEYGYNSLRQQLSGAECSVSELLALSSSSPIILYDEIESVECALDDITTCIDDAESTLEVIKSNIHPCGEGDWELVVEEDYSVEGNDECPGDWVGVVVSGRRFCGGQSVGSSTAFCDSAVFSVDRDYRKVCGRIVGYGYFLNTGFIFRPNDIEQPYLDGVSLTHGEANSRTHIWSFVASIAQDTPASIDRMALCPCHPDFPTGAFVPSFIGNDYFCESGVPLAAVFNLPPVAHHLDDPLWDGRQCHETCCNSSPYFVKALDSPTSEQLEFRICNNAIFPNQNNIVEKMKIFIQ